jgi:hypothetical protein
MPEYLTNDEGTRIYSASLQPGVAKTFRLYSELGASDVLVNLCRADFWESARTGETAAQAELFGQGLIDGDLVTAQSDVETWKPISTFSNAISLGAIAPGGYAEFELLLDSTVADTVSYGLAFRCVPLAVPTTEEEALTGFVDLEDTIEELEGISDDISGNRFLNWDTTQLKKLRGALYFLNDEIGTGPLVLADTEILGWIGSLEYSITYIGEDIFRDSSSVRLWGWLDEAIDELVDALDALATYKSKTIDTTELESVKSSTWTKAAIDEIIDNLKILGDIV